MSSALLTKLLDLTMFSPFFVALGWYILRLHREKNEAQAKAAEAQARRVEDAKAVAAQLIALNDKWHATFHETLASINGTLDAHKRAWGEVKTLIKDLREQIADREKKP
jgi:hypothetical protein